MARVTRSLAAYGFAALFVPVGSAGAQNLFCLPGIDTRRIDGDLDIASRCELERTEVRGDVTIFSGGSLVARDVRIDGNLTSSRGDFVTFDGGRVDGNVELDGLVGDELLFESVELRSNVRL